MRRFLSLLLDVRVVSVLGLLALAAFLMLGAEQLRLGALALAALLAAVGAVAGIVWMLRWWRQRKAARQLEQALQQEADGATAKADPRERAELQALRTRMQEAVKTIKGSKLGQVSGAGALYELPWYMIIGNPAAGKSTAVVKSGLTFPFADSGGAVVQGIGGTRNCDWFFTSEGILLDTAGRYAVHEEDRAEWLGFLALLKKHRPKAPINGIVIAASVAEVASARPEAAIQLAKNLRQRVQELTEKLEVFAPVYLVFTKADLISGFVEFFEDRDPAEREQVWGATLPYEAPLAPASGAPAGSGLARAVEHFDREFDLLRDGLKELALARMSLARGHALPPGVLTFPLEFAALKPALRAFVATLFEDNPYQYQPIFRGLYFTSAVQEGLASSRAREQVAEQFGLRPRAEQVTAAVAAEDGFFLKRLFSQVVFADRHLVRQHASRDKLRWRAAGFGAAMLALAAVLGGWSWSYLGNRQLTAAATADLQLAARLQAEQPDLAGRMKAMGVLQDRIEQLAAWRRDRPWTVGLGLYQGDTLERSLRAEYYQGLKQLMLKPVSTALEGYLAEVNQNGAALQPVHRLPEAAAVPAAAAASAVAAASVSTSASAVASNATAATASATGTAAAQRTASRYVEASPTNVEDAYNALKTYLMLAERSRMEPGHLTDQITRFWRGWLDANRGTLPRDELMRQAERMITFAMGNLHDGAFPQLENNFALVDQTRETLRRVVQGMPARERVYAEIRARANTRFAPVTVAGIVGEQGKLSVQGSAVVPGAFTQAAWTQYIDKAIKEAANTELTSVDWVLKTSSRDDLSLAGSPEQVRMALTELYKAEYVREWKRFMQGVTVTDFAGFESGVEHMRRLGDPTLSPLKKVVDTLWDETSWDNPSVLNERLGRTQNRVVEWIKSTLRRGAPSSVDVRVDVSGADKKVPMGAIGREFEGLARIMMTRDSSPPPFAQYMKNLAEVRTQFNEVQRASDSAKAARTLVAQTLQGKDESQLHRTLRFVDDQMFAAGLPQTSRDALRPLLVRPLMQAFNALLPAAELAVNRDWAARVHDPFTRTLAAKYPFSNSTVEAAPQEIAKVFGADGAIAKFTQESLNGLVHVDEASIRPAAWAEMGIALRPEFMAGFARWTQTLEGVAGAAAAATPTSSAAQRTAVQFLPQAAPGLLEYTIEIDGQVLRYRNAAPVWTDFVWPSETPRPGARITGITLDGQSVELFNAAGASGVNRMMEAASLRKLPDGLNELAWGSGPQRVAVHARLVRLPGPVNAAAAPVATTGIAGLRGIKLPAVVAGPDGVTAAVPARPGGAGGATNATGAGNAGNAGHAGHGAPAGGAAAAGTAVPVEAERAGLGTGPSQAAPGVGAAPSARSQS